MERMFEVNEFIEECEKKLYSQSMVTQLSDEDISPYERGRVAGRIDMLNTLKGELLKNEDSNTERPEGIERSTRTDNRVSL